MVRWCGHWVGWLVGWLGMGGVGEAIIARMRQGYATGAGC
jgi:hypothetical protein